MSNRITYATQVILSVPLYVPGSNSLATNLTLAAGDVKVSIDGGALTNITALPTENPVGSGLYDVTLSVAETTGKRVNILVIDQTSTKDFDDTVISRETEGHASAQHSWLTLSTISAAVTGDWTEEERAQIRYRLAIDGDTEEPEVTSPPPITITPPADASKTTAYLIAHNASGVAEGVNFYFVMLEGPGEPGYSFDESQITATSDSEGLVTVELYKGATYRVRRDTGKWIKFIAEMSDTSELPEILGKPLLEGE